SAGAPRSLLGLLGPRACRRGGRLAHCMRLIQECQSTLQGLAFRFATPGGPSAERLSTLHGEFSSVRRCAVASATGRMLRGAMVVGSGMVPDRVEVPAGSATLAFEPATDQRHDPTAPLDRLQRLMREAEAALVARTVLPPEAVALVDGPLNFYDQPSESVVGV